MKIGILLLGFSAGALALQQPLKQYMVSYKEDTPPSVVDEAKNSILAAGGKIVHEFNLLTGFIADTTSDVMAKVDTLSTEHRPTIEEDSVVRTQQD